MFNKLKIFFCKNTKVIALVFLLLCGQFFLSLHIYDHHDHHDHHEVDLCGVCLVVQNSELDDVLSTNSSELALNLVFLAYKTPLLKRNSLNQLYKTLYPRGPPA